MSDSGRIDRVVPSVLLVAAILAIPHPLVATFGPLADACSELLTTDIRLLDLVALLAVAACRRDVAAEVSRWTAAVRRSRAGRVAATAVAVLVVASFAAHPSWVGVETLWRWTMTTAVAALAVARWRAGGAAVWIGALLVTAAVQAPLAFAQAFGDPTDAVPLAGASGWSFGTSTAGKGTMGHPYGLGVLMLVACAAALRLAPSTRLRRFAVPAASLCAATATITYGRSVGLGILALAAGCALATWRRHPVGSLPWWTPVALAVAVAIPATTMGDGWVQRAGTSTSGVATATSARDQRLQEAASLVGDHPLLGVGPGRYVAALAQADDLQVSGPTDGSDECPLPAHNVVAHGAAEMGLPGGVLLAAGLCWLLATVLRGWRRDPLRAAAFVAMLPMLLLDAPYANSQTLMLLGLWAAVLACPLRPPAASAVSAVSAASEVSPPRGAPASGR
jgi:hypothetical protein